MKFIKYTCLAVTNILMFFIGSFLSIYLPVFAIGKDHLPSWLSWFDTPDNTLDGDDGYKTLHAPFKGTQTGIKQYINRWFWLLRNPSYGFDISVLGATVTELPVVIKGDLLVSNNQNLTTGRKTGLSGSVYITDDSNHFEYYYVRQWGSSSKCFRLRLGWKLSGYINAPQFFPLGSKTQFVFSVMPAASFTL